MRTRILVPVTALMTVLVLATQVGGASATPGGGDNGGGLPPCSAGSSTDFYRFYLGDSYTPPGLSSTGLPITFKNQVCTWPEVAEPSESAGWLNDPDSYARMNYVSYHYGDCNPAGTVKEDPGGCMPPVQVQSWDACERSPADYNIGPEAGVLAPDSTTLIRGVLARIYDAGSRVELTVGSTSYNATTVVLFGESTATLLDAATKLRTDPFSLYQVSATQPLPPPIPAALDGTLSCK